VVKPVKPVKPANVQRGIREIIKIIGKWRIYRSSFITNVEGTSPRTA
jgi:hypothetical protein